MSEIIELFGIVVFWVYKVIVNVCNDQAITQNLLVPFVPITLMRVQIDNQNLLDLFSIIIEQILARQPNIIIGTEALPAIKVGMMQSAANMNDFLSLHGHVSRFDGALSRKEEALEKGDSQDRVWNVPHMHFNDFGNIARVVEENQVQKRHVRVDEGGVDAARRVVSSHEFYWLVVEKL